MSDTTNTGPAVTPEPVVEPVVEPTEPTEPTEPVVEPTEPGDYVKVFTIGSKHGELDIDSLDHDGNKAATLAELTAHGWRATDKVEFVGATTAADGVSVNLEYLTPVVPAS